MTCPRHVRDMSLGVVDVSEARKLATYKRRDAAGLVTTFAATLLFDVEVGIPRALGVAL